MSELPELVENVRFDGRLSRSFSSAKRSYVSRVVDMGSVVVARSTRFGGQGARGNGQRDSTSVSGRSRPADATVAAAPGGSASSTTPSSSDRTTRAPLATGRAD